MNIKEIITFAVGDVILIITAAYISANQKSKVMEWLKVAVTDAEKRFGQKTGQIKLRKVYSWFIAKFPVVAVIMPFKVFSAWVDTALKTMNEWIDKNQQVKAYVEGADDEGDTEELA